MSRFFIDRPIFAWVLGLVLMLLGGIEVFLLPVAQFPSIAAPQISITVTDPGASAQTVTDTVVRPILQQMSGLDGLEYLSSSAQSDGTMEIDLTFIQGTDPNIAQVQVQNKLSLAQANLPPQVTQQGIKVEKSVKNFMLGIGFISADGSMSDADISDYVASNIQDPLSRIPGVGDVSLFGSEYAMRIWLDPDKLYRYALTVADVTNAISAQNVQVSSGEFGGMPARHGQRLDATIIGPSRFETPAQFENILLKVNQDGSQVRLHDVARVELGVQQYTPASKYNGKPASALALKLAPGANQLATEAAVKAELNHLRHFFPPGLKFAYPLDTEPFITLSITEVVKTLFEAVTLVFVVMFVFLQNFRATLIPTIAVPIVLLGTFGVLAAFGYSINTLTMLAMVLAVGLLVDDAIVVVENVDRVMTERRISPREAARESMGEISGALVGIALVLSAVFLPMAFFSGSTGVIYRQFSVTIVSAMTLSVLVALILTPSLCATLLKPVDHTAEGARRGPFGWFNRGFDRMSRRYGLGVGRMIAHARWSLVDDAIVVVENVDRVMTERRISPREAARESMGEISGALVGIALVLSAVFLPMAFFSGSTGVIYRQFSVTIVSAMTLSVLVALILTPSLCATLLKPVDHTAEGARRGPFGWFNRGFDRMSRRYGLGVGRMIAHARWSLLAFALITAAVVLLFARMPTGFLPDEDQALIFGQITTPPGATAEQTEAANKRLVDYLLTQEKDSVDSVLSVTGFNFAGRAQNAGFIAIKLKDWSERPNAAQSAAAVAARTTQHFHGDREARIIVFNMPAALELGNATGFDLELEDRGALGHDKLLAVRDQLLGMAMQDPSLSAVRPNGLEDAPQFQLEIDREKANAFGVAVSDLDATIQGALGSEFVNQFLRDGRVKQVYVQGAADARMLPSDLSRWYVRNAAGNMVPFDAFLGGSWTLGPQKVESYNGLTSFEILGTPAPTSSTGAAMATMTRLIAKLPAGIGYEWTGQSYEEQKSGSQTGPLYAISLTVILLCLAALYESWPIPISVLLVVPLGVIGAIIATSARGLDNDVYFQVGLLTTVGLAVKNAILIVEFAKAFFDAGTPLVESAIKAAQERLRPILMTSIAFGLGSLPLAIASGAGAASRMAIGTAVIGGMLSGTALAVFFVPVFFVAVLWAFRVKPKTAPGHLAANAAHA